MDATTPELRQPGRPKTFDHITLDVIDRLAGKISARQRTIIEVCQCRGYREAAEVLGISMGTVKSRLNRARRAVQDLLDAEQVRP